MTNTDPAPVTHYWDDCGNETNPRDYIAISLDQVTCRACLNIATAKAKEIES